MALPEEKTVPVRLAEMDGKLDLIIYQLSQVEPRVKVLEDWRRETEKTLAAQAGAAAQMKTWLPILIAACALIWSVTGGI